MRSDVVAVSGVRDAVRRRTRVLDWFVRHSLAFGVLSLISFLVTAYSVLVLLGLAFRCYEESEMCSTYEPRFTALLIAAGVTALVATLAAIVGSVGGLVRGWPGVGRHRGRLIAALLLSVPVDVVVMVALGAWFVDRYRH